jgi:pyruvate dehydrogenase E1 component alpha subunit
MPRDVIASFDVSRLSILNEEGAVDPALEPDLDPSLMQEVYRSMFFAREADQRMIRLQRQGRIGTFGPSTGQEACVVGPSFVMGDQDWLVGSFRELGGRLARGEPLVNHMRYYNGYEEGTMCSEGTARRLLPVSVIVGAQLLHAVGIAYAMKLKGEDAAVLAFHGDGATSEGDFHEALNFAAVWKVPVVFICQNNQWAISIARDKQTRSKTIAQKAVAYGMPGMQVDGNDVLAVMEATREALERARSGEGPTLIEAVTYRLMMHTTADDPKRYRDEAIVEEWWKKEPLVRFRRYLEAKGYWDEAKQETLEAEVQDGIEAAVAELERPYEVKPDAPFDHVFGTSHEEIERQRGEFLASLREEASHA